MMDGVYCVICRCLHEELSPGKMCAHSVVFSVPNLPSYAIKELYVRFVGFVDRECDHKD